MPEFRAQTNAARPRARRRSRPLVIAPFIPLLALLGIFGIDEFHGTRYLSVFVTLWCILLSGLFAYVLVRVLEARRARR